MLVTPALAATFWTAASVTGSVLSLQDGQWAELPVGSRVMPGVPVRTLQSGGIELTNEGTTLELAADSAVQIDQTTNRVTTVTQFAGTVEVDASLPSGQQMIIKTPDMTVVLRAGRSRLTVFLGSVDVVSASGSITVTDNATGAEQTVASGGDVTIAEVAAPSPGNSANSNAGGNPNPGNGNSNAGGNGNGNGNGNSGGNGNGGNGNNGNGNGNGNKKPK